MKHVFLASSFFTCLFTYAQHWSTYRLQADSIYKSAGVKSIQWKEDSTRSSLLVEADLDRNGRVVKMETHTDPTTHYEYDAAGKQTGEWDWDGKAEFTYDAAGRVHTKNFYSTSRELVKEVTISYNPTTITSKRYEDGVFKEQKTYIFETPTTVKEYSIEKASGYGELKYTYTNTYNAKGQIIKTRKTMLGDFLGEATYQYHANGLLDTITLFDPFNLNKDAPPVVQKLVYTYY